MKFTRVLNTTFLSTCLLTTLLTASSEAYGKEEAKVDLVAKGIIAKVVSAYGGDKLLQAKAIKITDHNKGPWPGESEHPGVPEIWRINEELTIDFNRQRKSLLSYRVPRTDLDLERWILDGDTKIKYDLFHNKYSYENWMTYDWLGGSIVRGSDTMLAKRLDTDLTHGVFVGDEFYRGKVHKKLEATMANGQTFIYYVEHHTGLITKMLRQHPRVGALTYVFSNHAKKSGVTYSRDMNFFVGDELRLTSVKRDIELNPEVKSAFEPILGFEHWGEEIDNSDMTVEELSKGVYQVGKGRALSLFVEQQEHFVALGSASEMETNFAALKQQGLLSQTSKAKVIKYLLVTHHHRGNLRGLAAVVASGTQLLASLAHKQTVIKALGDNVDISGFVWVKQGGKLSLGNLEIMDISTAHSKHNLLTYMPSEQLVYAEDHYETQLKAASPRVFKDMVTFARVLDALNLEIKTLVDGHSRRKFSYDEFQNYTQEFTEKSCTEGYAVCNEG